MFFIFNYHEMTGYFYSYLKSENFQLAYNETVVNSQAEIQKH